MRPASIIAVSVLCTASAISFADEADGLDPVAAAFSRTPIWGVRLSPDGTHVSRIEMHPSGVSVASVVDLTAGTITPLITGSRDSNVPRDVMWCGWKNDARLICGLRALGLRVANGRPSALLVGVESDGRNLGALSGRRIGDWSTRRPYHVVDWLQGDPDRVLVTVSNGNGGYAVARINVYDGTVTDELYGPTYVTQWISDAEGQPRLYLRALGEERWYVREANAGWTLLNERDFTDTADMFTPLGFLGRNEVLFIDRYEGRRALFALDLDNGRSRRLIYAHERFDVSDVQRLGKESRLVSATYYESGPRFEFFDERVAKVHAALQSHFVGKTVRILDEDWNRRYYLAVVEGGDDPGTYYRFDSEGSALLPLFGVYPSLDGREFAEVRDVTYAAADGTPVPAYLTMPPGEAAELPPAIVLPHDGPATRDFWRFDFLAQYLAAKGYVVLQSNYRGSAGYGEEWEGEGGFRDWRRAVADIADGADYLAREGLADAERICVVGWGYGGYAALMSVIENRGLYRCVVSIAGITETRRHGAVGLGYVGGRARRAFVGRSDDVLDAGSPMERVHEIDVPVLLFHGRQDGDVLHEQSDDFARFLVERLHRRDVQLIEYEYAEHDIRPENDRLDMLTRIASFLGRHVSADRRAASAGARRPGVARPPDEAEEITVRGGKTLGEYRFELEQAHAELIRIFNEENSGDDNDITCRQEPPTGTRLPRRVCRSNAQSRAEAAASRSVLNSLLAGSGNLSSAGAAGGPQDTAAVGTVAAQTEAFVRGAESRAEIEAQLERLQRENERLYQAVLEYLELEDEYNRARQEARR